MLSILSISIGSYESGTIPPTAFIHDYTSMSAQLHFSKAGALSALPKFASVIRNFPLLLN